MVCSILTGQIFYSSLFDIEVYTLYRKLIIIAIAKIVMIIAIISLLVVSSFHFPCVTREGSALFGIRRCLL